VAAPPQNRTAGEWQAAVEPYAVVLAGALGTRCGVSRVDRRPARPSRWSIASQGGRYIDQLVDGFAHESKVGYKSLNARIGRQISKDVELIQTEQIQGATWHFFKSPVTGVGGPSQPLLNLLQQSGINVIVH